MMQLLRDELVSSIQGVSMGIGAMLPKLIGALIFIVLGWIFGSAVGRVVHQLVQALKLDAALQKVGVDRFLNRVGYTLDSGLFLGWLAKVFFVIVFFIAAFDVLGLTQINEFLKAVLAYIPQVVVAAVILFLASIAADMLGNLAAGTSRAVGAHVAHLLGVMTRYAIWIFSILIALSQLGIAAQFMQILFTGIVAMFAIAGGLAFGLGGKDAASEFIKNVRTEIREGRKSA